MKTTIIDVGSPLHAGELDLRFRLLREALGMGPGSEVYEHEADCIHVVAIDDDDTVVGCVLFHPQSDRVGRLLQMAVENDFQGQGIGQQLVRTLEIEVARLGFGVIELHARDTAVGFYAKLGYEPFGEPYEEVGIPHQNMRQEL